MLNTRAAKPLSSQSVDILRAIARGWNQFQITRGLRVSEGAIAAAAEAALELNSAVLRPPDALPELFVTNDRNRLPWLIREDGQLRHYFRANYSVAALAKIFRRKPEAIRTRLEELGEFLPED